MAKRRGNNEGTIFLRSNGTWRTQVSLNGERLSFTGKTRKECQEWIKQMSRKIDNGLTYEGSKITLELFILEWLIMKSTSLQPATFRQYEHFVHDYIIPGLGDIILINLRVAQIQSFYNKLIKDGVGFRSIEYTHAVLRGSLSHAVEMGLLNKNPAKPATPPKAVYDEQVVLSEEQIQTFMIAVQSLQPEYFALYHLCLTTGMRIAELLGLKWQDLDWDRQTIKVKRQLKKKPKGEFYFDSPKTKAGLRTLTIGPSTISSLRSYHHEHHQKKMGFSPEWRNWDLLFTEEDGSPIRHRKLYKRFKVILQKAGLPDIRIHDLRHTAATQMLINGVDILTVSKRLGHSKSSVTLDIYGHMIPGVQEKAAQIMDDITTPISFSTKKTAPELHQENSNFLRLDEKEQNS